MTMKQVIRYKKPERLSRYTPDFILPNKIIEGKDNFSFGQTKAPID